MLLHLNPNSGLPVYRQMIQQLKERIASGQLASDTQLPSVRDLSAELSINPLTVAKVYQFLERDGFVEFRRGQGTFVASDRKTMTSEQKRKLIQPAVDQLISESIHLGLSGPELLALIQHAYDHKQS